MVCSMCCVPRLRQRCQFPVAIAKLMELSNTLADDRMRLSREEYSAALRSLVLLLSPMAPVSGMSRVLTRILVLVTCKHTIGYCRLPSGPVMEAIVCR